MQRQVYRSQRNVFLDAMACSAEITRKMTTIRGRRFFPTSTRLTFFFKPSTTTRDSRMGQKEGNGSDKHDEVPKIKYAPSLALSRRRASSPSFPPHTNLSARSLRLTLAQSRTPEPCISFCAV